METSLVFDRTIHAWNDTTRYVSSRGGTRSGKTFANLQLLIIRALKDRRPTITSVVSETFPHLKRGAIRDFLSIMGQDFQESRWSRSDYIYTFPSGSIIEFFSADSSSKVHGPARDYLYLNECQNIPYDTARQLFVRTKGKILLDYNPTHSFWVMDKVEPMDNCRMVQSTYLDNRSSVTGQSFLSVNQVAEIESNKKDRNWWKVYGEGQVGELEGLIFDFSQIDAMPEDGVPAIGLDFGFVADPTAIVMLRVDTGRKTVCMDEICYKTQMLNRDIIEALKPYAPTEVYADCAEPKSIEEIRRAGINIRPSDKGAPVRSDRLTFQLQWMQGWEFKVTKRSVNLIRELRNYTWAKDSSGNTLNHPIDVYNHAIDAARYALFTKFANRAHQGKYSLSII